MDLELLVAISVFVASAFFYFSIYSLAMLLVLRFLHGMSFGVSTTAAGTIASDLIPEHRRGEGMGYYTLSMNLAMVIGPFLGLLLVEHTNFNVLFAVLSVLSVFALLGGWSAKVPALPRTEVKEELRNKKTIKGWKQFVEPSAVPISVIAMLLAFAYSGILIFVYGFAKQMGLGSYASYFFVVYAIMIIVSRPFTGRWFDRVGDNKIIYPSIILFVIGIIVLSQANSLFLFLLSAAIIGLGYGTVFPCLQTIALRSTTPHRRGIATGTFFLLFDLGVGIGSVVLGSIAARHGESLMYLISAGVVAFSLLVYYGFVQRKSQADRKAVMKPNPTN